MKYKSYSAADFKKCKYYNYLSDFQKKEFEIVTQVLHFKVNEYVLDNLINWSDPEIDPIFRLLFPQKGMMLKRDYRNIKNCNDAIKSDKTSVQIARNNLYPPPNRSYDRFIKDPGIFHLYPRTLELFPVKATTCHAYCTYCHRWMPFVDETYRFNYSDSSRVTDYLKANLDDDSTVIDEVIYSGGDPMLMSTNNIKECISPILKFKNIKTIRFVTKSLAWWPYRFTSSEDGEALLEFFHQLRLNGKHVTFMAHFTHPVELESSPVQEAISSLLQASVSIRCQGPVARGINDRSAVLSDLWSREVKLGMIPYYLFADFNYGPSEHFKVPLARLLQITQEALKLSSGLVRTVRAPVLSDKLMKICIEGVTEFENEKYFVLRCVNSPTEEDIGNIYFEKYDQECYRLKLDGVCSLNKLFGGNDEL